MFLFLVFTWATKLQRKLSASLLGLQTTDDAPHFSPVDGIASLFIALPLLSPSSSSILLPLATLCAYQIDLGASRATFFSSTQSSRGRKRRPPLNGN